MRQDKFLLQATIGICDVFITARISNDGFSETSSSKYHLFAKKLN